MREMAVTSFCTVSPEPGRTAVPGVVHIPSGEAVDQALAELYSPLKLRRLDAYSRAALLAARLALEAAGVDLGGAGGPTESSRLGIVVCSGLGPIPATNAFMDSFMDFGPRGASPTTFSQTVHNLAASTIAMFMGLVGPALSVSQPSLGLSSALITANAWFDADLADTILFGAVDDRQAFSGHLFPDCAPCSSNGSPVAAFAVLSALPGSRNLLTVDGISFSEPEGNRPGDGRRGPGPVDVLSEFLSVLGERSGQQGTITESWDGYTAKIAVSRSFGRHTP